MTKTLLLSAALLLLLVTGATVRSSSMRQHGYSKHQARSNSVRQAWYTSRHAQLDHWQPLECGGLDAVDNLHFTFGPKEQIKERLEQKVAHGQMTCDQFMAWLAKQSCTPDWCVF